MEGFELAILFTTAGAVVGATLVKVLVSALKSFGLVPEHGRGVLYTAAGLSAALVALALLDAPWIRDSISGQDILVIVLSWLGIYTASVGVHETVSKVQRITSGTTDPDGPDR